MNDICWNHQWISFDFIFHSYWLPSHLVLCKYHLHQSNNLYLLMLHMYSCIIDSILYLDLTSYVLLSTIIKFSQYDSQILALLYFYSERLIWLFSSDQMCFISKLLSFRNLSLTDKKREISHVWWKFPVKIIIWLIRFLVSWGYSGGYFTALIAFKRWRLMNECIYDMYFLQRWIYRCMYCVYL